MIVAVWLVLKLLFFISAGLLLFYVAVSLKEDASWPAFKTNFLNAFKSFNFRPGTKKYPVELYKWVICDDDDEICEDSIERACLPAMDIAEWMKKGLPHHADGKSLCGKKCHCRLIHWQSKYVQQKSSS